MVKRRDLVKELESAGFVNKGGSNHDVFVRGLRRTTVPRHREIENTLAEVIRRQAGLK